MTCVSANGTLDLEGILLVHAETLRTLKGPVTLFTTNLTILVLFECTVEESQFAKLLLLVNILFVINDHKHLFNHIGGCVYRSLVVTGNDDVKGFIVAFHNLAIASSPCSFLDGTSSTDCNLAAGLGLQLLLCLTTWSNDQSDKVVCRMLLDGNTNFLGSFAFEESRLTGCRIHVHKFLNHIVALRRIPLSPTNSPSVFAFSIRAVN